MIIFRPTPVALSTLVLLSAWLGAALLVAAVVAPAAFAVLPTRTAAGALVGRVLPVLFWSGMALGVTVALLGRRMDAGLLGTGSAALLAGACAAAQLLVAPRIESLRIAIGGPVDALGPADPRRMAFGRLHGLSVLLMAIAMLAGLIGLFVVARHLTSRRTA